jgi:hypothetical protein
MQQVRLKHSLMHCPVVLEQDMQKLDTQQRSTPPRSVYVPPANSHDEGPELVLSLSAAMLGAAINPPSRMDRTTDLRIRRSLEKLAFIRVLLFRLHY